MARHLLSQKAGQVVNVIAPRHLAAVDLQGQIAGLVAGAAHGRTARPVWHVHIDPPPGWDRREVVATFLRHLETEFELEDQPRAGVLHSGKGGSDRLHCHIVYSLVRPDGRVLDLRNSYRRREKVAVITAAELGLPPPPIPRPRSILTALLKDGNEAAARWMLAHYPDADLRGPARVGAITPERRHIAERTVVPATDIRAVLATAWPPKSARTFQRQLAAAGLALALGDEVPVIVDRSGAAHSLAREVRAACKAAGRDPPRARDVRRALDGLVLRPIDQIKRLKELTMNKVFDKNAIKRRVAADLIGGPLLEDFKDRIASAWRGQDGKTDRLYLADGTWVHIDRPDRKIVAVGLGDAGDLARRLAQVEDFEFEQRMRRRKRRAPLGSAGPAGEAFTKESAITSGQERFDYWASAGYMPSMDTDGNVGIEVAGTLLVDTGDSVQIHTEPVSDEAIVALVGVARDRWGGSMRLYGTWTDEDRARVWVECQRRGVCLVGYEPPAELVARWAGMQPTAVAAASVKQPAPAVAVAIDRAEELALLTDLERKNESAAALIVSDWAKKMAGPDAQRWMAEDQAAGDRREQIKRARGLVEQGLTADEAMHEAAAEIKRDWYGDNGLEDRPM